MKVAKKRFPLEQWYPNSDWWDLLISDWLVSEALSKSSDKNLAQTHSFSVLYQHQKFEFLYWRRLSIDLLWKFAGNGPFSEIFSKISHWKTQFSSKIDKTLSLDHFCVFFTKFDLFFSWIYWMKYNLIFSWVMCLTVNIDSIVQYLHFCTFYALSCGC